MQTQEPPAVGWSARAAVEAGREAAEPAAYGIVIRPRRGVERPTERAPGRRVRTRIAARG
ncbi:MAG: hypothetical protein JWM27_3583 [Gemmatimonadetes bacterium]|nr:hypothetical protein [Gemmatimonadota bacterium]